MFVKELMSTDIVTVEVETTLDEAVEQLLVNEVGSVVVLEDGNPTGIVTETDALEATLRSGRRLSEIPVAKLQHNPVITISPNRTVQGVARRMADNGIKKVPVMDDLDLVGIVTLSDIVWHLSDIRKEASSTKAVHEQWESSEGL